MQVGHIKWSIDTSVQIHKGLYTYIYIYYIYIILYLYYIYIILYIYILYIYIFYIYIFYIYLQDLPQNYIVSSQSSFWGSFVTEVRQGAVHSFYDVF
jgi:hypothetical protein